MLERLEDSKRLRNENPAIDKRRRCGSGGDMFANSQGPLIAAKLVIFLLALAVLALPLARENEGFLGASNITAAGKAHLNLARPQHGAKTKLAPPGNWSDQAADFNPSFLKIDYKQNLLVWPVVAGNVTRSPPFSNPF